MMKKLGKSAASHHRIYHPDSWRQKQNFARFNTKQDREAASTHRRVPSLHTHSKWDCVTDNLWSCARITNSDTTPGICSCPADRAPQKALFTPQLECRLFCGALKPHPSPVGAAWNCALARFYHKYYSWAPLRSLWVMTTHLAVPSSRKDRA